jgi:hypothetical protein
VASPFPMPGGYNTPTDPGQQQDPGSFADQIRAALDKIRAAIASDGPSDQDRLILEQMTTLGQKLLAGHEQDQQAALGSSPAMNFVRRATGG